MKLEEVRAAIIKAVPEIVELKFGCVYVDKKGLGHCITIPTMTRTGFILQNTEGGFVRHEEIKSVTGRPIRLTDVLVAIDQRFRGDNFATVATNGWFHFGRKRALWNLRTDDLSQQSSECIDFIHSILCV